MEVDPQVCPLNLVSILRCSSPLQNPVYVSHIDPSVLSSSVSSNRHPRMSSVSLSLYLFIINKISFHIDTPIHRQHGHPDIPIYVFPLSFTSSWNSNVFMTFTVCLLVVLDGIMWWSTHLFTQWHPELTLEISVNYRMSPVGPLGRVVVFLLEW